MASLDSRAPRRYARSTTAPAATRSRPDRARAVRAPQPPPGQKAAQGAAPRATDTNRATPPIKTAVDALTTPPPYGLRIRESIHTHTTSGIQDETNNPAPPVVRLADAKRVAASLQPRGVTAASGHTCAPRSLTRGAPCFFRGHLRGGRADPPPLRASPRGNGRPSELRATGRLRIGFMVRVPDGSSVPLAAQQDGPRRVPRAWLPVTTWQRSEWSKVRLNLGHRDQNTVRIPLAVYR